MSVGIKGRCAVWLAVTAQADLLNPRLRIFEPRLALCAEHIALTVERDRLIKAGIPRLEPGDNGFKSLQRVFKGKGGKVFRHRPRL